MSDQGPALRGAAVCAAVLAVILQGASVAQQGADTADAPAAAAERCLNHPSIRRTRVLGDRNIVFVTRDKTIYNNQLPRECPSLRRGSLVNYTIENNRICAGDNFQILWDVGTGGTGTTVGARNYIPAFVCKLGAFVPITEDELEVLTQMTDANRSRRPRRRSAQEAVTTEQVELPSAAPPAASAEAPAAAPDAAPAE